MRQDQTCELLISKEKEGEGALKPEGRGILLSPSKPKLGWGVSCGSGRGHRTGQDIPGGLLGRDPPPPPPRSLPLTPGGCCASLCSQSWSLFPWLVSAQGWSPLEQEEGQNAQCRPLLPPRFPREKGWARKATPQTGFGCNRNRARGDPQLEVCPGKPGCGGQDMGLGGAFHPIS